MDAPNRIWVSRDEFGRWPDKGSVEYIRADLHRAEVEAAVAETWERAEHAATTATSWRGDLGAMTARVLAALRAAKEG